MAETFVLEEVEAIRPDPNPELLGHYRACDFCHESACDDIWANRPWRTFYLLNDSEICCEHCISKIDAAVPA